MDIIIKETGKVASLFIPDLEGNDCTLAFVEATSGTGEWEKTASGIWVVTQTEYNWWLGIANSNKNGLACLAEHAALMEDGLYKSIWWAETSEIEHFSQVHQDVFDRISTGVLTVKVAGVKRGGSLRIEKMVGVTNKNVLDGVCHIDCEGVFNLSTTKTRYEFPIGVTATYITGQKKVSLNPTLDCSINLSLPQAKVAYGTLYRAVKAELEGDGHLGIEDFDLYDGQ